MKLIMPCFFNTEELTEKEEQGIPFPYTECDVRRVILYNVDAISQTIDCDEKKTAYPLVYAGKSAFTIPMKMKSVERLVDFAMSTDAEVDGFAEWKRNLEKENG
jgi:hypothetical protein